MDPTAARDAGKQPAVTAASSRLSEQGFPETGYVPPPVDLSHLRTRAVPTVLTMPARFDWRELGKVSPVKNQGACGSCYAFAALANLESRVLIDGDGLFDFSENNVKECEWYEASCGGGNDWMVANFLTTAGAVLETCDPYVAGNVECKTSCQYIKTLTDWRVISGGVPASVDVLKNCIMAYGPVYSTLYVGNRDAWRAEFASYDGSYVLHRENYDTPNHAVLIVGWDDDLPHAGGTGAWIVKNSWGSSWGGTCGFGSEGGYFTIAYGSAAIGANSSFAAGITDYSPADILLYYDEGGFGGSMGILNNRSIWGLSKFVAPGTCRLKQVEFWTADARVDVDIYIYDDFDGSAPSGLLASEPDNAFDMAGYHSVPVTEHLTLDAGEDVYVAVKVTNAVSKYPLVYDSSGPRTPGRCYMSSDGIAFSEFVYGDLGIRLRTSIDLTCSAVGEVPVITDIKDVPGDAGHVTLAWTRIAGDTGSTGDIRSYRIWRRRREVLNSVLQSGVIAGPVTGEPYQHGVEGSAWEVIGSVNATGSCHYEFTASTHCDMTPADTCWTYFCVSAHTRVPGEHFDSPVARGYSVADDAPAEPGGDAPSTETVDTATAGIVLRPPEPNPSRDGFAIAFELDRRQWVELSVFDVRGRKVAALASGLMGEGRHSAPWSPVFGDAPQVPSGIYFLRLTTPSGTRTARLVLIR